ncbi:MAG TPA: CRTAC1 family protein [Terriglobia bacterium]|nr:CRTAC1 family protein [Terriglobia bacterium]
MKSWTRRDLLKTGLLVPAVAAAAHGATAHEKPAMDRQETAPAPVRFQNVTAASGVQFVLENNPTPSKHLVETMAGGVAAFDYDGDGLTDIYFTNGAAWPSLEKTSPKYWNRLYRNLGGFHFQDVTEKAGVAGAGYSMGAAAADYDNDGHVDLFVTGVGRNILYHNRGDGTFEDVTAQAGIKSSPWSIGAAWFDYDNDGRLDLFVVSYLKWSPASEPFCGDASRQLRVYCHPRAFEGLSNTLYHNEGNGKFKDVSQESGIAAYIGKGMGVAIGDYDGDGLMDIFVTNDKMRNFLFHNLGHGKFEEVGMQAGVALLDTGNPVSGMGADFRDYDNDGLPDIAFSALAGETFPLYRNLGHGAFEDVTYSSSMALASRVYSGFGLGMFDFNNDGWKDLFTANAHVNDRVELYEATQYKLHNAIFLNRGDGTFQDASQTAGPDFLTPRAHRGAAFADFNNDGRIDAVVTSLGEAPELWKNVTPGENSWLILKLEGVRSNRDGIGAEIHVDGQFNHMTSAMSYASSSNFGVHFGTGKLKGAKKIEIRWPSGTRQVLTNVPTNQVLRVREPSLR